MRVVSGYRWYPSGTRHKRRPDVGDLVPYEHAVWRVVEVRDRDDEERPYAVTLRPVEETRDDPRARDSDLHLSIHRYYSWDVYPDEHYPICACCYEPLPCRYKVAERAGEAALKKMGRYETAGVCPACEEPVTGRQKSLTFSENLEVLGGPSVTFHVGRRGCSYTAGEYEKRWVAADPERRRASLTCRGRVTNHNDGTYDCTELAECPGPSARHDVYTTCSCPDCHARGVFDCHPSPSAIRNGDEGTLR